MIDRSVGHTKTKDPRHWRVGKDYKGRWDSTVRYLRRQAKVDLRKEIADGDDPNDETPRDPR